MEGTWGEIAGCCVLYTDQTERNLKPPKSPFNNKDNPDMCGFGTRRALGMEEDQTPRRQLAMDTFQENLAKSIQQNPKLYSPAKRVFEKCNPDPTNAECSSVLDAVVNNLPAQVTKGLNKDTLKAQMKDTIVKSVKDLEVFTLGIRA